MGFSADGLAACEPGVPLAAGAFGSYRGGSGSCTGSRPSRHAATANMKRPTRAMPPAMKSRRWRRRTASTASKRGVSTVSKRWCTGRCRSDGAGSAMSWRERGSFFAGAASGRPRRSERGSEDRASVGSPRPRRSWRGAPESAPSGPAGRSALAAGVPPEERIRVSCAGERPAAPRAGRNAGRFVDGEGSSSAPSGCPGRIAARRPEGAGGSSSPRGGAEKSSITFTRGLRPTRVEEWPSAPP